MLESNTSHWPIHKRIYLDLRKRVLDGEYKLGDRLPTESDLMAQHKASRSTVIRALRDLVHDGLLERRRGSGTYIRKASSIEHRLFGFCPLFVESGDNLPYVEGMIHQHLANLASHNTATLSLQCLIPGDRDLKDRMLASARQLLSKKVSGVLYYAAELSPEQMHLNQEVLDIFTEADIPVVLIDRDIIPYPGRSEFSRIGYDNRRGGFLLTEHLVELGCKRIAFVGIPEVSTAVADRLAGYCEALRAYGKTENEGLIHMTDELSMRFCQSLITKCKPDAIICKSDHFAALLGRHITDMGLQIGKDIKLAGFDDDPIASLLPVPLTTIRLPVKPFVRAAFEELKVQIEDPARDVRQTIIDCEFIARESTLGVNVK